MIGFFHGFALGSYLVACVAVVRSLASGRTDVPRMTLPVITAGVLAHLIGLTAYTSRYGELPLVGLGPSLSTLAALIGVALISAALLREVRPVALVLLPIMGLLITVGLLIGIVPSGAELEFRGIWFIAHVVFAFFSYASLALAFAAGLLYLLQFRALKGKNFGRTFRFFPSLDTLDRLGRGALLTGWPSLTLALVLGWAWTVRFLQSLATENPQVIWGVLTWLVFATAIGARLGGAGGERRGALVSVFGFVVVVIFYFVLRLAMAGGRVFL
jgi:ABC-type transport system involved in cytochrome c biogenesis permease subunit